MVRMRVGLRIERGHRGEADDEERVLFEGEAAPQMGWVATVPPPPGSFAQEHGHISADVEHLLLQDQVRLEDGVVMVASTLRLEGHPLRSLGDRLHHGGPVGRALHRAIDLAVKQAHEVLDIYQDPVLRRQFAHAIRHPHLLTRRMQRSLLFLVLLSSLWAWVLGLTVFAIAAPGWVQGWNAALIVYFHALTTNLFNPLPVEATAVGAAATVGTLATVLAGGTGKAVGAWIIFNLGPTLRRAMANLEAKSAATRRVMRAAERFARRYGYVALGLMLAVPFSPLDIVPVYLFSTMGLRLGPFLFAVFVGFALRLLAVVLLGEALLGLF